MAICFFSVAAAAPDQKTVRHEHYAHIAQAVEHSLGKGEVTGSIPVVGTSMCDQNQQNLMDLNFR